MVLQFLGSHSEQNAIFIESRLQKMNIVICGDAVIYASDLLNIEIKASQTFSGRRKRDRRGHIDFLLGCWCERG